MATPKTWRLVLCDLNGVPIHVLDAIANKRMLSYRLNQPAALSFEVPSEDARVAGLHSDGFPRLSKLRRVVKAYRREPQPDGTNPFVLRFAGHVWTLSDQGDANTQRTSVTCYSPLKLTLEKRLCRGTGGEPTYVAAFTNIDAGQILKTLVERTIIVAPTGITTTFGTFDAMPTRTATWENAKIQTAFADLVGSSTDFDIIEAPLDRDDQVHASLSIKARRGVFREKVVWSWGGVGKQTTASVAADQSADAAATDLIVIGGTTQVGDQLIAVVTRARGGLPMLEELASFTDTNEQTLLLSQAQQELLQRGDGRPVVRSQAMPIASPLPFDDFDLGDTFAVFASARLRGGFSGTQRCYGFDIALEDDGTERLSSLITSTEG